MARDPKRIDEFCDRLKVVWKRHPDLRFGQLITLVFSVSRIACDPFYMEDDKMITHIENDVDGLRQVLG